jgi:hypothetical protein
LFRRLRLADIVEVWFALAGGNAKLLRSVLNQQNG